MKKIVILLSALGNIVCVNNIMATDQIYTIQLSTSDSNRLYNNLKIPPKTEWHQETIHNKIEDIAVRTKEIESSDGMFQINCQVEQYSGFIANTQKCTLRFISDHAQSNNKLNESFISSRYIIAEFNESRDVSEFYKHKAAPYVPVIFNSLEEVTLKHNNQDVTVPRFHFSCEQDAKLNPTVCTARGVLSQN